MLAQLLIRRVSSKQIPVTANTFWRCTITSKCCSLSTVKARTSQACRTARELHTFASRIQSATGLPIRTEISPLMKRYVSSFAGVFHIASFWSSPQLDPCGAKDHHRKASLNKEGETGKVERSWEFEDEISKTRYGSWLQYLQYLRAVGQITLGGCFKETQLINNRLSQLPMWGLIIVIFAVVVMWQTQERHWMIRNWMVSIGSVLRGRLHTMLTYSISNNRLDHLIEDMLGLYFFGGEIARIYGGSYMLMIYLVGGIAGSVSHIAYCTFLVPWLEGARYDDFNFSMTPYILGASGATNALMVIHVLLFPHHIILANYFLPVQGIVFGAYLVLADIYDMYEEGARTTHAGAVAGALSGVRLWRRIKRG